MPKSNLLKAVLMTGLFVISAQSFADFNEPIPAQQGQTSVLQQPDQTSSSPFENNNSDIPEPQQTSTHTNQNNQGSWNANSNHGGNSNDDVPEDMD